MSAKTRALLASAAFILFAVVTTLQAKAADSKLWTTQFSSASNCSGYARATGAERFDQSITGFSWPMPKGSGAEFIDKTVLHLNAAAAGRANNKLLLERLMSAANSKAFTSLDFGSRGGSSPSFVTSVMVRSVAHAVSYLRKKNAVTPQDLKSIDAWVRILLKNSETRAGSLDHKASIAAAKLAWGTAVSDSRLYKQGISSLDRVMQSIRNTPKFSAEVRVNNEIVPIVLMAAHILRLNGNDYFAKRFGKHNLHDVVAFHAAWVSQTGSQKVKTEAISDKVARSILKSDGWGTHQAWIPLYLAHFPKTDAAADVRELHSKVKRAQNLPYYGRNMGVHSACYFGLR